MLNNIIDLSVSIRLQGIVCLVVLCCCCCVQVQLLVLPKSDGFVESWDESEFIPSSHDRVLKNGLSFPAEE